jgi:hypothetical protein
MCSESRKAANVNNAKRSTGPRSPLGKSVASRNSFKHGLYARARVVAACEEAEFRDWRGQWLEDYRPDGTAETDCIERAALSSWKLRRCSQVEAATLDTQRRGAGRRHDDAQADRADLLGRRLVIIASEMVLNQYHTDPHAVPDNPAALYRQLCSFKQGADWLLAKWGEVAEVLEHDGSFDDYDRLKAALLAGKRPGEAVFDHEVRDLFLACFAAAAEPWALHDLFRQAQATGSPRPLYNDLITALQARYGYPDAAAGRAALQGFIARHVGRLEALKADALDIEADLDREAAEVVALFDDTKAGAALRRYETACERDLHRALADFLRLRRHPLRPPCGSEPIAELDPAEEVMPIDPAETCAEPAPSEAPSGVEPVVGCVKSSKTHHPSTEALQSSPVATNSPPPKGVPLSGTQVVDGPAWVGLRGAPGLVDRA